eukprot:TRINITY_DN16891_c0_g1_i2.p1 TRINITY_DN16891_c0_g1~~TRINITY_DN16891_c0_g1_i2.p1  ORF type:complete len:206 (+),score=62.25 TRINITY_DN16891_c0_g1_i2:185-802(+)
MGIEDQLFNLKFTAKQLARQSKKCEKEEKAEKLKTKKAIEKGNLDGARIYAQNAIRQKHQAMNCLRLSSRVDAVASRLESAIKMGQVTKSMSSIVSTMGKAMSNMKLEQVSQVMEKFEKQFEDLDVQSTYMDEAMSESTSMTTPQDEVDGLIQAVATEHNLELGIQMDDMGIGTGVPAQQQSQQATAGNEEDELFKRLENLKAVK